MATSSENISNAALLTLGLAALHGTAQALEVLVCFPTSSAAQEFILRQTALQRVQFMQYKSCANMGASWIHVVSDVSMKDFLLIPQPTSQQLTALRVINRVKTIATGAGVGLVCIQACLSYQSGIAKHEQAVLCGTAPILNIEKAGNVHRLKSSTNLSQSSLVLRTGTARQVGEMLADANSGATFYPLPVLLQQSSSISRAVVERASGQLKKGCYLTLQSAPLRLVLPATPSPAPHIIIQSGGVNQHLSQASDCCLLADRIRREQGTAGARVVVVHVGTGSAAGPSTSSVSSETLASCHGSVLTIDGPSALLCGILGWVRFASKGSQPSEAVLATSSATARIAPPSRTSPTATLDIIAPAPPLPVAPPEPADSVDGWYLVESVGGAVRAALLEVRGAATFVSAAWLSGWRSACASLPSVSSVTSFFSVWLAAIAAAVPSPKFSRPAAISSSVPIRQAAPILFIDFDGHAQSKLPSLSLSSAFLPPGWRRYARRTLTALSQIASRSDSVGETLISGLANSGLSVHTCASPEDVLATHSPREVLILVRRSENSGGDVASLQAAAHYGRRGFRVCAVTDTLSYDDIESAGGDANSRTKGSALTASTLSSGEAPGRVYSFCAGRVAPGVWAHCSARLVAGVPEQQIATEMQRDMLSLLQFK